MLSIITFDFMLGMFVGFLGFMSYDLIKCALWMKRIVIKIERSISSPSTFHLPSDSEITSPKKKSENREEDFDLDEDEDLSTIIDKVRNQKKEETPSPDINPLGQLLSELKNIDKVIKDVPDNNKQLINGMFKIFESATKGEKPDPEIMKNITEEMTDVVQRVFYGPMTEKEKEEERKDSDIILKRLKDLHVSKTNKEE